MATRARGFKAGDLVKLKGRGAVVQLLRRSHSQAATWLISHEIDGSYVYEERQMSLDWAVDSGDQGA